MKVLVTGATGFLGCNLVHHLVARGDEVRVLRRAKSSMKLLENLPVEPATGDVTDAASVMAAAAGVEGIYHVAGLISFWKPKRVHQHRVNVGGTQNVIEAAVKNRVRRLVHTSSVATIGLGTGGQADETVEWNCDHLDIGYKQSKHLGEVAALQAVARGLEVVVTNPGLILGPRDINWGGGRMFKMVAESSGIAIPDSTNTTSDVDDVCQGHIAAMEIGRSGQRYILGGEHLRTAELFGKIADVMGRKFRVRLLPHPVVLAAAYAMYGVSLVTRREPLITPELLREFQHSQHYSSAKAIRELGYPQTRLRATLEKTYRWYKENGYLA